MNMLYTGSGLIDSIVAGHKPDELTGCDTVFFSSGWGSEAEVTHYVNTLASLRANIVLALGGDMPHPTIERMVKYAVNTLGTKLTAIMLPDEQAPDDYDWLEAQATFLRAILPAHVLIGINTTLTPTKLVGLSTDFHSIDGYYNASMPYGSIKRDLAPWEALFQRYAPTKPLMFIGQAHNYIDQRTSVPAPDRKNYPLSAELMTQLLSEVQQSSVGHRLAAWGHYCYRKPIPYYHEEWLHDTRDDLCAIVKAWNASVLDYAPMHDIYSPVMPVKQASVYPSPVVMKVGEKVWVDLINGQAGDIVVITQNLAMTERIPPGRTGWTVNAIRAGETVITYSLRNGQTISQKVTINPAPPKVMNVFVPRDIDSVVLKIER